jgi:O-antigen ligase
MEYTLLAATMIFLTSLFFSIAVNSLALGLMALTWLSMMIVNRRNLIDPTPLDWFFFAYVLAEILSTIFSVHPEQSLLFSKRVLLIGVVYFFASMTETRGRAKVFIALFLGSAVIVAFIGVVKLIMADPETTQRLGIFQFYMTTSELMMIAALLLVPFLVHPGTPRGFRWLSGIALLPVFISLYATVTRGAYLAVAAGLLFIAFVRNKKLLVPFLVVVILMVLFAPPYVYDRLKSIVDIHHPENVSRLMLWKAGVNIFADHPILGVGDIDLHELFLQYIPPGPSITWGHEHNVLLQILVTLGAVGFVAVAAMFTRMFVVQWRIFRSVKDDWLAGSFALGSLAVFMGFQMNGLTEWSFGDQEVVLCLWTTLGITLALGKMTRSSTVEDTRANSGRTST